LYIITNQNLNTKITPFKTLYNYDPNLQIDINPKDNVIKREVLVIYDRIILLYQIKINFLKLFT